MSEERGRTLTTPGTAPRPTTLARDQVIAQLSDAFAAGALEVEEFEHRVTIAQRSLYTPEIQGLVADLPTPAVTTLKPPPSRTLVPSGQVKRSGVVLSIMGGAERKGSWTMPRTLTVITLMGGAHLDLRQAFLPAGVVEIRVAAVMGGVEIIVPPNLAVESTGGAIMGGFEHVERAPAQPEPDAPVLRVTGLAFMGGVHIEMRLPGETGRDARRRRKREDRERRRLR